MSLAALLPSAAQYYVPDPAIPTAIGVATVLEKKGLESQQAVIASQQAAHLWSEAEMKALGKIERTFSAYLDSCNAIIAYVAQGYGFYQEASKLADNIADVSRELDAHPTNMFAVALSPRRNDIYVELIESCSAIIDDLYKICLDDRKMTEAERIDLLFSVRPKLMLLNRKLAHLASYLRYTNMYAVWLEIVGETRTVSSREDIAKKCLTRWGTNALTVK